MIKFVQYLCIQEVHTIIPPYRHGSNLRHVIPKTQVPDYITYLGTCIYIFGKTGGVIWPLSLCPLLVAQAIVYIIFNMQM